MSDGMNKPIEGQWTQNRHELLALAGDGLRFTPSSQGPSYYSKYVDDSTCERVDATTARGLKWFLRNGLIAQPAAPGCPPYAERPVKRTAEGDRVFKVWNERYGTPGATLSPEAIAAIPEIAAWLETLMRHYRGDVSAGVGVASIKLLELHRKVTGTGDDE